MRVIEPHQFKQSRAAKRPRRKRKPLLFGIILSSALVAYILFGQPVIIKRGGDTDKPAQSSALQPAKPRSNTLKTFTGAEFEELYSAFAYPNTQPLSEKPYITGNEQADARIRSIAEKRGYKLSAVPVSNITKTGEPGLTDNDLLQPNALIAWKEMKAAAKKDGIPLQVTSAYRSIETQRALFIRRMTDAGITVPGIVDGYSDVAISLVLSKAAIPGYSRHHTGYTMDLACDGIGLEAFKTTSCYSWLSKNNFENTKRFGWVPSYPEEADNQGPEPEAWEYIWVGKDVLYE